MVPSLSMLGVRCQPGPWLLASSQRVGKWKGLPGLSWSLSDPDIKHDAVLAMHFVLLSCEPRVYKQGEWSLLLLGLYQSCFWLQALLWCMPLSCKWVSAATFSWLMKGKKKEKRNQADPCCLLISSGPNYTKGTAVCQPGQCHPPAHPYFAPESAKWLLQVNP